MDPAVATVAVTAATTLVTAMTTDSWERAKHAFSHVLRSRRGSGADTGSELEQAREALRAARERGDASAEREVRDELAARLGAALEEDADRAAEHAVTLRELLAGHPEAEGEIQAFVAAVGQRGTTVYNQRIEAGGAGAQGPGAAVTVNHYGGGILSPQVPGTAGESA